MLHMTCANMSLETVLKNLKKAKNLGIRNILALRGGEIIFNLFIFSHLMMI